MSENADQFIITDGSDGDQSKTAKNGDSNKKSVVKLYHQKLTLNQISPHRAVTEEDARLLFGQLTNNEKVPKKEDIANCIKTIEEQRNLVKGWTKTKIVEKIMSFTKKHQIQHPEDTSTTITTLRQLEDAWAKDESIAEKVWWVLLGEFNKWNDWDLELEEAMMKEYQWEYIGLSAMSRSKRQKGCVAKIVVWQKAVIVKYVNAATLRPGSHGKSVSLTQPREMIAANGGKQFRRKKGMFYPWMVRSHDTAVTTSKKISMPDTDSEQEINDNETTENDTPLNIKSSTETAKVRKCQRELVTIIILY